jgi:hypothetical protein
MGGYYGAVEISGWDRDLSSKITYRIDIGTDVLHIRRTVTVPFPSEEPWEEEEEEPEPPLEEEEESWEQEEEESEEPWEDEEEP